MSNNRPNLPIPPKPAGPPDVAGEVHGLIKAGKAKQAVERAKDHYKRFNTPDAEKLLVEAYISRIGQFQGKGQAEDAGTLIKLVRERFPAHAGQLAALETTNAATGGMIDQLVAPLANPNLPADQREAIETAIRQKLTDLQGLGECKTLTADHPLKVAAIAVWKAFEAAAAGPVTEEAIALPEVSRRSPLAGWRMLIRAIAALHRNDDENCRKAIDAIPADAAARRLTPILVGIMEGKPSGRGASGALHSRISAADAPLREILEKIEAEFSGRYIDSLEVAARKGLSLFEAAHPELSDALRQRLMFRFAATQIPLHEFNRILGVMPRDAAFWRRLACGLERGQLLFMAAFSWERFLAHAVAEKWFADNSIEAGMVYLHVAEILLGAPLDAIAEFKSRMRRTDFYTLNYRGQSADIADLKPKNEQEIIVHWLSPATLFAKAAAILGDSDTYTKWSIWARYHKLPVKEVEDILLTWNYAHPRELEPILQLSILAEERKALQLAAKRLDQAEAIDPFNPKVRRARIRQIMATLWRHTKAGKAHLVEKDIAQLEALPAFKDGDRAAFILATKIIWNALKKDTAAVTEGKKLVYDVMGELAGKVLINTVVYNADLERNLGLGLIEDVAETDGLKVSLADVRLRRLGGDIAPFTLFRPPEWDGLEIVVLKRRPAPLSLDDILWLGKGNTNFQLEYAASAAGLATATGAMAARFLLMRAPTLEHMSRRRVNQCLRAAQDLARQFHDEELMRDISDEMSMQRVSRHSDHGDKPLSAGMLADILAAERKAHDFPKTRDVAEKAVVLIEDDDFFGFGNPFGPGFFDNEDDDDFGDDDYDDY